MTDARLRLDESELVACVACGLCLPHCPTFRVTGDELKSPRGRIAAMRAVTDGRRSIDDSFADAMDTCIQCRGCEAACPSGVQFGHLMEDTRAALEPLRPAWRRAAETIAFRGVLPNRKVLDVASRALAVGQRVRMIPKRLGLPELPVTAPEPLVADPDPEVYLFTGCVMDAWQRDVHRAALRVMRATGARVGLTESDGDCCGALHVHAGRHADAVRLARRVITAFPGRAPIVVDSAGCGATLLDYGRLLGPDDGAAFAARVVDLSSWLVTRDLPLRPGDDVVVVQDPCHLRHVQKAHEPVHMLLGRAYDVRATSDDGLCCGAGGAFSVTEPELSHAVRDRKIAAIHEAAAGIARFTVASANPGCAMHLAAAGLTVKHPAELLEARLGSH
jgi:glycolate oxidase iron-sulfur subunit